MRNLAITGCKGRMGRRILVLAIADGKFEVSALLEHPDAISGADTLNGIPVSASLEAMEGCDVLIDFTSPEASIKHLQYCRDHNIKMVIGTTGFSPEQEEDIRAASAKIPIVFSSNMSVGVNILFQAAQLIAKATPDSYMVRMTEAHHIHKKDAPSGTAKTLAETITKNSGKPVGPIESIREGEIIGDHEVIFESGEDLIVIKHHAKTRDIFARGALVAAEYLIDKTSGLFTMRDVLNLTD